MKEDSTYVFKKIRATLDNLIKKKKNEKKKKKKYPVEKKHWEKRESQMLFF